MIAVKFIDILKNKKLKCNQKIWAQFFSTLHCIVLRSNITEKVMVLELKLNVGQKMQQTSCKFYQALYNIQNMMHISNYSFEIAFLHSKKEKNCESIFFWISMSHYDHCMESLPKILKEKWIYSNNSENTAVQLCVTTIQQVIFIKTPEIGRVCFKGK